MEIRKFSRAARVGIEYIHNREIRLLRRRMTFPSELLFLRAKGNDSIYTRIRRNERVGRHAPCFSLSFFLKISTSLKVISTSDAFKKQKWREFNEKAIYFAASKYLRLLGVLGFTHQAAFFLRISHESAGVSATARRFFKGCSVHLCKTV